MLHDIVHRFTNALGLVAHSVVHVDAGWIAVGVALSVVAQLVRTRGWHTILRAAYPHAERLRAWDTCWAYMAGAGLNGVIPARGGDIVKLALVRRRVEGGSYATLAATFLPETVFETVFGTGLVVWALVRGFLPVPTTSGELPSLDVTFVLGHPILTLIATGALVFGTLVLVRWLRRRAEQVIARFRQGFAIFGSPRRFVTGVATWQALSRVIRLGSLGAFMHAFGLPVTLQTCVLVMAAQGGGRIIPIAPVSAGLRLAMLSYGFVEVTGHPVDIAEITAFTVGVGAVLLVVGLLISLVILLREFGTIDPRRAVARARAAVGRRDLAQTG